MRKFTDMRPLRLSRPIMGLAALMLPAWLAAPQPASAAQTLRVCAASDNLPFSNQERQGFENKIASLVAHQLREKLSYSWWGHQRGLVHKALDTGRCDVVIGLPTQYAGVETTAPYYWSSYVFVSRADRHLNISSIKDGRLKHLRIGVEAVHGDRYYTPPARMLADTGLVDNLVAYPVLGGLARGRIINAVAQGKIDIAAIWGPVGGYFAKSAKVPLTVTPIGNYEEFSSLLPQFRMVGFQYDISMGVRTGDDALRNQLDQVIEKRQPQITAILRRFGVPLVNPAPSGALAARDIRRSE